MATDLWATILGNPVLTLAVGNNATDRGAYHSVDYTGVANTFVVVTATVRRGQAVTWTLIDPGGTAIGAADPNDAQRYRIPLDHLGNVLPPGQNLRVRAQADGLTRTVDIRVVPVITAFAPVPGTYVRPTAHASVFYSYALSALAVSPPASQLDALFEVTTAPLSNTALAHVQWAAVDRSNGDLPFALTHVDASRRGVPLDDEATIRVTVAVPDSGQAPRTLALQRLEPGLAHDFGQGIRVALERFTYAGDHFRVTREDPGNLNLLYSSDWSRLDAVRAPQGYEAGGNLRLNAVTVRLLGTSTVGADTRLRLRGTAWFRRANALPLEVTRTTGAWTIANGTGPGTHAMGDLDFGNLPDEVAHYDPLLVFWEASDDNGATWEPLTVSDNTVYLTAAAPVLTTRAFLNDLGTNVVYTYDSLLAISCDAAAGIAGGDPGAVRDPIARAFQLGPNGANPRVVRLNRTCGAPLRWVYWRDHRAGTSPAQDVNANRSLLDGGNLFTTRTGAVACGVWADMLLIMWALHGKGDGHRVEVVPRTAANLATGNNPPLPVPNAVGGHFLVRRWSYNNHGQLSATNYTHAVASRLRSAVPVPNGGADRAAAQTSGLPGQNNPDPPPSFGNHFIVRDGNNNLFFDPSYGTVAVPRDAWCDGAIAGLLRPNQQAGLQAGYVTQAMGQPDGILANRQCVALRDMATDTWVP